jgi:hypothetical protein
LGKTNRKLTLVVPDIHFGEDSPEALALVTKTIATLRPWRVVQLGDLLDCAPFSTHQAHKIKLAREYDFRGREVEPARKWIATVLKYADYFHLLEGNHEYRCERWCLGAGLAGESLWEVLNPKSVLLGSQPRGRVGYTPYIADADITSRYHITKDLIAVHGWSTAEHASSVHLRKALVGGWSVVHGHTHRIGLDATRHPVTGRVLQAWSPGCLRTFTPQYTQANGPTRWNHGFSLVYVGRRSWTNYVIPIQNGEAVLPDGRQVRV